MKLCNIGHNYDYETEKLIRLFLPFEKTVIVQEESEGYPLAVCKLQNTASGAVASATLTLGGKTASYSYTVENTDGFDKQCERKIAIALYNCFTEITEYNPPWGILTGIRPARLFSRTCKRMGNAEAEKYFSEELRVQPDKLSLCRQAVEGENKIISLSSPQSFSLYLSIPFCPSRCSYCSFVSHSIDKAGDMIPEYVDLLCKELAETAAIVKKLGLRLETVYMGGGTPTTLTAAQMDRVLKTVNEKFDVSALREFTVEAGRPDTITAEKLSVIKNNGVTRISINPQTFNDDVLMGIGRKHNSAQTFEAFRLARVLGFDSINMDLIAGLPGDTYESFKHTLETVIKLNPESVTVHSLSMKRASTLTKSADYSLVAEGAVASQMVDAARKTLSENGILPYYMYRQSKTVGNLENVGYAKKGFEGLYNVYIMDETHTILACGASAVTKLREPGGDNIERIFNYKYPYEYISRFNEQLLRKKGIQEFYEKYPTSDKQ